MTMYKTIPERVEAAQFFETEKSLEELRAIGLKNISILRCEGMAALVISSFNFAMPGEYVVKSSTGTFYACRPDKFAERYTLASEPDRDTPMPARREIAKEPTREVNGGLFGKGTTIWFCPRCNMFNTPSHKFCWKCGQALTFDIPSARAGAQREIGEADILLRTIETVRRARARSAR